MKNSKELRVNAWNSLKGKFWPAFGVCFIATMLLAMSANISSFSSVLSDMNAFAVDIGVNQAKLVDFAVGNLSWMAALLALAVLLFIDAPVVIGKKHFFLMNVDSNPEMGQLFFAYNSGSLLNIIKIYVLMVLKIFLWSLLLFIPGIIKGYEYAMIPYIVAENPAISHNEAFAQSKAMMQGNKFRLFKLHLSFIGWALLIPLTLGIGSYFLDPYFEAANAEFYADLKA